MPLGSYVLNLLAKPSGATITGMYVQNSVTNTASTTITIPTVLDGDVGIFFASCTTAGNAGTVPTGWTGLFSGSLNYSFRISYKTLTAAESGTSISSGLTTGTRSNILLIVRGRTSAGADAVIPSYAFSTPLGETTTGTPANRTVDMLASNQGAIGFGMWASNGTITARGFVANYGNTPTTTQLTEYSSNTAGINYYVKALSSFPYLSGGTTYTQRDNVTFSMADYGSNATAVFYIYLTQSTGGIRTAYPIYSPYKVNSPALTTSNFKFGSASLYVPTSVSPINTTAQYFTPGTGAYTIEWWGYQTAFPTNSPGWFDMNFDATQVRPLIYYNSTTNLRVIANSAATIDVAAGAGNSNWPSLNNWHHYALVREGTGASQLKLYFDGVLKGTGTDAANYSLSWNLHIGGLNIATSAFGGQSGPFFIDEFRVSDTARYTGAFTPPSTAFADDANTRVLYHFDGDNNSYYFPDDNS